MGLIPINLKQGSVKEIEDLIVGIDFGTTNSLIAIMEEASNKPIILKHNTHHALTPSIIFIDEEGTVIVGKQAQQQAQLFPQRTITSVKRLIGKSYQDLNLSNSQEAGYTIVDDDNESLVRVAINNKNYSPTELSSFIIKKLKQDAETILNQKVHKAVITVPAYFNDTQRQAVKDAGKLAGLDVLRIINEPTAAGLAYGIGIDTKSHKTIAVYDLGGGTFDISILQITGLIFEVLATKGDTHLGGDDIDMIIVNYWKNKYPITAPLASLKPLAEEAKKALSSQSEYRGKLQKEIKIKLDRKTLNTLIQEFVNKTLTICKDALKDAKLSEQEIDEVIMVGGSTRTPYIKTAVSQLFKKQANTTINPDEVVALGAAIQANILAGKNRDILLLDVSPLSLGLETSGGLMEVLVPRNTTIPSKAQRTYTTQKDGQANMRITIFQGERDLVKDNRKLGEFILRGIPPMPAGIPKVEISFFIDADGLLTVKAKEQKSGIAQQIDIKPQYGLNEGEVEHLLTQSIKYAQEDMHRRSHLEAKIEAEQLINTTKKFIHKNASLLSAEEITTTQNQLMKLASLVDNKENKNSIYQAIDELNKITTPFSERVLSKAIQESLQGKNIYKP